MLLGHECYREAGVNVDRCGTSEERHNIENFEELDQKGRVMGACGEIKRKERKN